MIGKITESVLSQTDSENDTGWTVETSWTGLVRNYLQHNNYQETFNINNVIECFYDVSRGPPLTRPLGRPGDS